MPMSLRRARHLVGGVAASIALALGALAGTASAAAPAHATVKPENCAILLTPTRPHQSTERIQSYTCSTRQVDGVARPAGLAADPSNVPIITFYQYTNFSSSGGSLTIWGQNGPCSPSQDYKWADTRPVDWPPVGEADWGASSWQTHNSCWATTLYYGENYGLPKYQYAQGVFEAGQIGAPWSNHVWSIWTGYSR
jgi:hypothetical protein